MFEYFLGVLAGLVFILISAFTLSNGYPGAYWGVELPSWAVWVFLPVGVAMLALSILGLLRGKPKPKTVTDEELAQAKAKLEATYRREHGEDPKYPEEESEK